MARTTNFVLIVTMICCFGICPGVVSGQNAGQYPVKASENWLALADEGKYSECWETTAELMKKAPHKKRWLASLTDIRQPLGKMVSREFRSARFKTGLPGAPCFECFKNNQYVIIQYHTAFENKALVTETITPMKDSDGTWRIFSYYITDQKEERQVR